MLTLSGSLRVLLALEPCDMRKSFDGLHALVLSRLGEDPRGGAVFCFINRSHTLIKLLHWDGKGLWVHAKKLQRGTFRWPKAAAAPAAATLRCHAGPADVGHRIPLMPRPVPTQPDSNLLARRLQMVSLRACSSAKNSRRRRGGRF